MKALLLLLLLCLPLRAADIQWNTGERLVFIGDSITDAKRWTHYVAAYLHLRHPDKLLKINQHGRGGTTMASFMDSGNTGYEEYHKVVSALQPDRVSVMFGHNGSLTSSAWQADYERLISEYIIAEGAQPILVGPHPQTTSTGKATLGGTLLQPNPDGYSTRLGIIASAGGHLFSDTWNRLYPQFTNEAHWPAIRWPGTQSTPQTHPGPAGHIAIAAQVIENLVWSPIVSSATVDFSSGGLIAQSGCAITNLVINDAGGVDFTRTDECLPWAIDEEGRALAESVIPGVAKRQQYTFRLLGLGGGNYDVRINGQLVASLTQAQLDAGWNMAGLTAGPAWEQGQEVLGRLRDLAGVDRVTLAKKSPNSGMVRYVSVATSKYKAGLRGQALIDAMAAETALLDSFSSLIHQAAAPQPLNFSITRQ